MAERFNVWGTAAFVLSSTLVFESIACVSRNPIDSARAARTYFLPNPSCSEVVPSHSHYGTIAVFGAGTYVDGNGVTQPNSFQRSRLRKAAEMYVAGYADNILLVDSGRGEVLKSSQFLLNSYINEISKGKLKINSKQVNHINNSVNSADNVRDLGNYMGAHRIPNALGVTNLFHYNRLDLLVQNYNANVEISPVECGTNPTLNDPNDLSEVANANEMKKIQDKEKLGIFELVFDQRGDLSISLKE